MGIRIVAYPVEDGLRGLPFRMYDVQTHLAIDGQKGLFAYHLVDGEFSLAPSYIFFVDGTIDELGRKRTCEVSVEGDDHESRC